MEKTLINLYVPSVQEEYDLFAPADMKIRELVGVLAIGVKDLSNGHYRISNKEMLLRIREQNRQNLIYDFAENLIEENAEYLGTDIAADAKVKVKKQKKQTKEGGKTDAKEKKTRGRKSVSE